jgi:hypothetical protein
VLLPGLWGVRRVIGQIQVALHAATNQTRNQHYTCEYIHYFFELNIQNGTYLKSGLLAFTQRSKVASWAQTILISA